MTVESVTAADKQREDEWQVSETDCPKCTSPNVMERMHEDSEGHEDWEFRCAECKHHWWVDGIDS